MTEEEKAEEYFCEHCENSFEHDNGHCSNCSKWDYFIAGFTECRKEIEKAKKEHLIFTKNEIVNFTSKCVWEALNPESKMCVPNAMFIKIEELLADYIRDNE